MRLWVLLCGCFLGTYGTLAFCQNTLLGSYEQETDTPTLDMVHFFGRQNHFSALETAGAHGPEGIRLGTGVAQIPIPEAYQKGVARELSLDSMPETTTLTAPKFWLTKGLWYPIDVGFSFTSLPGKNVRQFGGYAQYTLYEAFRMPALAIRGHHSHTFGLKNLDLTNYGGELVTSWGLRELSGYASLGMDLQRASISAGSEYADVMSWQDTYRAVGLQVSVAPCSPF